MYAVKSARKISFTESELHRYLLDSIYSQHKLWLAYSLAIAVSAVIITFAL